MHDNKVRLSRDVLEKAEVIATEWGLKNARAAVEAVFRRYSDDYLKGRGPASETLTAAQSVITSPSSRPVPISGCEALDVLEDLLAM